MGNQDIDHKFEEIYKKQSNAVFSFCLMRVSNREQASDLTQETFLRFWQTLSTKKADKKYKIKNNKAFIFTIAHRLVIDWYRKKKPVSLDGLLHQGEAKYDLVDDTIIGHTEIGAEGRYLLSYVSRLARSCQYPIYLRFVEGLSPKEIAQVLGITANSASVRINRGLSELRKMAGYDLQSKMI